MNVVVPTVGVVLLVNIVQIVNQILANVVHNLLLDLPPPPPPPPLLLLFLHLQLLVKIVNVVLLVVKS